jgi:hypothetical protein
MTLCLAKAQQVLKAPTLSILPPVKGENVAAFGYASTSTATEEGQQIKFHLNPSTSVGVVTLRYTKWKPIKPESPFISILLAAEGQTSARALIGWMGIAFGRILWSS